MSAARLRAAWSVAAPMPVGPEAEGISGDLCGIEAAVADICGGEVCGLDLTPVDACGFDACAIDVIPIIPGI